MFSWYCRLYGRVRWPRTKLCGYAVFLLHQNEGACFSDEWLNLLLNTPHWLESRLGCYINHIKECKVKEIWFFPNGFLYLLNVYWIKRTYFLIVLLQYFCNFPSMFLFCFLILGVKLRQPSFTLSRNRPFEAGKETWLMRSPKVERPHEPSLAPRRFSGNSVHSAKIWNIYAQPKKGNTTGWPWWLLVTRNCWLWSGCFTVWQVLL